MGDWRRHVGRRRQLVAGAAGTVLLLVAALVQLRLARSLHVLAPHGDGLHNLIDALDFPIQMVVAVAVGLVGGSQQLAGALATWAILVLMLVSAAVIAHLALTQLLDGGGAPDLTLADKIGTSVVSVAAGAVNALVGHIRARASDGQVSWKASASHARFDALISGYAALTPWPATTGAWNAWLALVIAALIVVAAIRHARTALTELRGKDHTLD